MGIRKTGCRRISRSANGTREGGFERQIAVELVVIGAIGVGLALLGPFGSYVLPLSARLLFWVGNILAGYAIFRPLLVVGAWLSKAAAISTTAANLIVLTLGAVPLTF
jgi:hypothetical protein